MASARFAAAVWLAMFALLLCSIGDWWGLVLLAPAALLVWVRRRVLSSRRG